MPEKVVIAPYNPAWPQMFEHERIVLRDSFRGTEAKIEHVGSTSVYGLGAKPVIDIMIGVSRLKDAEERVGTLELAGYEYVANYESAIPERRYFRKPRSKPRSIHLHCVLRGHEFWNQHLLFRDYLRNHPSVAEDYYQLKCDLSKRYNKVEYTEKKGQFISSVLAIAAEVQ